MVQLDPDHQADRHDPATKDEVNANECNKTLSISIWWTNEQEFNLETMLSRHILELFLFTNFVIVYCLPTKSLHLPTYQESPPTYLPSYLPTFLPSYLPTYLPIYQESVPTFLESLPIVYYYFDSLTLSPFKPGAPSLPALPENSSKVVKILPT